MNPFTYLICVGLFMVTTISDPKIGNLNNPNCTSINFFASFYKIEIKIENQLENFLFLINYFLFKCCSTCL